jgi:hypothetical protein
VEWSVTPSAQLVLPPEQAPVRTDGLWRTTCFEAFLRPAEREAYLEFNFSPSFAWAAYGFERYREGNYPLPQRVDPEIWLSPGDAYTHLTAEFEVGQSLSGATLVNLSAVIEERDGTKSYWALAHPPEGPPDFHHPACFVLELPPPGTL